MATQWLKSLICFCWSANISRNGLLHLLWDLPVSCAVLLGRVPKMNGTHDDSHGVVSAPKSDACTPGKWENWWSTIGFGFGPSTLKQPCPCWGIWTATHVWDWGEKYPETPTPHRPTPTRRAFALLWWHIPCCRPWANHHRPATSQGSTLRALALENPGMDHQDASTFHGQWLFLDMLACEPSIRLKSPLQSSPRTELGVCGRWMALAQQQLWLCLSSPNPMVCHFFSHQNCHNLGIPCYPLFSNKLMFKQTIINPYTRVYRGRDYILQLAHMSRDSHFITSIILITWLFLPPV